MSDNIKHECGIALIRLRKPLEYYAEKYGTPLYGLNKLYLLMEKMRNRGQDGAGVATIKLDMEPGQRYISRYRNNSANAASAIFGKIHDKFEKLQSEDPDKLNDIKWLKEHVSFTGELLMGHLRYGTHGQHGVEYCHPFLRQNNWKTRNLVVAGNFNLTNVDELFQDLVEVGQHPKEKSDTVTVLEKFGHFLDEENEELYLKYKNEGYSKEEITPLLAENLSLTNVLRRAAKNFDGGYAMGGMVGHGDAFLFRDPSGIRPAYYYEDEEIVVAASERPTIQTAFDVKFEDIKEVDPGHALIIKKDGSTSMDEILTPLERKACSFERIYFSRGSDAEIYEERKNLGRLLATKVLETVDFDTENTVFSFIPNTAEVAFYGLVKGVEEKLDDYKAKKIKENPDELDKWLRIKPRVEKVAIKDAKLRTFITNDNNRDELVGHVYDITHGTVKAGVDNLVMIDDSIVRGTTLQKSIIRILARLKPRKIIIVSSAPQIRYPDCYGIDMSKMGDFIAFRAAIDLIKSNGKEHILEEVYEACKMQVELGVGDEPNPVKRIYNEFTADEISQRISEIVTPDDIEPEVQVIYQSIENLHQACPKNLGDWYFTGDYPTAGGFKVVNRAYINFMEGKNVRAY